MAGQKKSQVWNGKQIAGVKRGALPGPRTIGELITCVNGLLTMRVVMVDGQSGQVVISEAGTTIEVPRAGTGSGGGGGGPVMMAVVSYHQDAANGDYLVCQPPGGGATVNVAVEPQLQSSIVTQTTPDGSVWVYSAYDETYQKRISDCTSGPYAGTELTEFIAPPFLVADVLPVFQCLNSGVTVDGVAAVLVAVTGRQWAAATSA